MNREVEVLGIGAGPSNLALAVALEELGSDDLARNSLLIERSPDIEWQQGLLLPWAKSQVSFVKDLVTLRDPGSKFTFLNYLHSVGRLDDFINMGSFTPYRAEISAYLQWVARSLTKVQLQLGCECASVEPLRDGRGTLTGWRAQLSGGDSITSRFLVIGAGRTPYLPPVLAALPRSRVVHSTEYTSRVASLNRELPYRVAVVGSAQSAAEMFTSLQRDLPQCDITWIMRSIGLRGYEMNKFLNELYYPSYVNKFFAARPEGRTQILAEMHRTNYSGVAPAMLDRLYNDLYLDRIAGRDRKRIVTMTDISGCWEADGTAVLELTDRQTGETRDLEQDLIFAGTGFAREMPPLVRDLGQALQLSRIEVARQYRLCVEGPASAACYIQGVNEATHGISDSLLSILAHRSEDIVRDIAGLRAVTRSGHHPDTGQGPGAGRRAAVELARQIK